MTRLLDPTCWFPLAGTGTELLAWTRSTRLNEWQAARASLRNSYARASSMSMLLPARLLSTCHTLAPQRPPARPSTRTPRWARTLSNHFSCGVCALLGGGAVRQLCALPACGRVHCAGWRRRDGRADDFISKLRGRHVLSL